MLTVSFAASELGAAITADAPTGGPLVDVCDEVGAPVSFSCRAGTCGTCRIEVLEGAEHFEPPQRDEQDLLDIFAAAPAHRLACQARLRTGSGAVLVRWIPEYE